MKTISRKKIDFVWLRAFDLFTLDISKLTASKILRQISVTLLTGLRKVAIFYVVIAVLSCRISFFLTWICLLILLNVTETTWGTPNYLLTPTYCANMKNESNWAPINLFTVILMVMRRRTIVWWMLLPSWRHHIESKSVFLINAVITFFNMK